MLNDKTKTKTKEKITFQATMRQALPKSCSWLSFKGTKAKNLGRKEYMRR